MHLSKSLRSRSVAGSHLAGLLVVKVKQNLMQAINAIVGKANGIGPVHDEIACSIKHRVPGVLYRTESRPVERARD